MHAPESAPIVEAMGENTTMPTISRHLYRTLLAATILGCPLYAQAAAPSHASTEKAGGAAEILSPAGNWAVESGLIDLPQGQPLTYCAISNTYGQDGRLEFYGTSGNLAAIKVDIPGRSFAEGQGVDVGLKIPGGYSTTVKASVAGTSTLVLNVKGDAALPPSLHNGTLFYIKVEGREYPFSLSGINNFSDRLKTCRDEGRTQALSYATLPEAAPVNVPAASVSSPAPVPKAPVPSDAEIAKEQAVKDQAAREQAVKDQAAKAQAAKELAAKEQNLAVREKELAAREQALVAKEQADKLARRESETNKILMAPTKSDPAMSVAYVPPAVPVQGAAAGQGTVVGRISEGQPAGVLSTDAASAPPSGTVKGRQPLADPLVQALTQKDVSKPASVPAQSAGAKSSAVQSGDLSGATVWRALKGSNLREVLALWSTDNDVELIWNAEEQYRVKESVNLKSSYEEAVQSLLEQYDTGLFSANVHRPVGQLYVDSAQGRKVLVIRSQAG